MEVINDEVQYDNGEVVSAEAGFMLSLLDPNETNSITFSEIVKVFTSHLVSIGNDNTGQGLDKISVLEAFVTKAIEQEENEKRIMIKLQERMNHDSLSPSKEESKVTFASILQYFFSQSTFLIQLIQYHSTQMTLTTKRSISKMTICTTT